MGVGGGHSKVSGPLCFPSIYPQDWCESPWTPTDSFHTKPGRRDNNSWGKQVKDRFQAGCELLERTANTYPAVSELEQQVMVGYLLHKGGSTGVTQRGFGVQRGGRSS